MAGQTEPGLIHVPACQKFFDGVGMASDVMHTAAEFFGIDFGARVIFDDDKVRTTVDVSDGDAAVRLHRVAAECEFKVIGRRRAANGKDLKLTERDVLVAGGDDHLLLPTIAKLHKDLELVRRFAR